MKAKFIDSWVVIAVFVACLTVGMLPGIRIAYPLAIAGALLLTLNWRWREWWRRSQKVLSTLAFVVLPILGYCKLVKASHSDQHLADLLVNPLMAMHTWALCAVTIATFAMNICLLSANLTAAAVGAAIVPVLCGTLGFPPEIATASVLIGTWGAVCSFGSAHARLISEFGETDPMRAVSNHLLAALVGLSVAAVVLPLQVCLFHVHLGIIAPVKEHRFCWDALLPLLPMLVLFIAPRSNPTIRLAGYQGTIRKDLVATAGILCCATAAVIITELPARDAGRAFLDGIVSGFVGVILVVAAALMFVEALEASGLIGRAVERIGRTTTLAGGLAMGCSLSVSAATGSSDAIVTTMNTAFLSRANALGARVKNLVSLTWLGGEMGRCVSPLAVVTWTLVQVAQDQVPAAQKMRYGSPTLLLQWSLLPMLLAIIVVYAFLRTKAEPLALTGLPGAVDDKERVPQV